MTDTPDPPAPPPDADPEPSAPESPPALTDLFSGIYATRRWGEGGGADFYSGPGSDEDVTAPYVERVRAFIAERGIVRIVDIGCGDFRVGSRLLRPGLSYVGVDVVPALVERNQRLFGGPGVEFVLADATGDDPLPWGELCLVRQMLQHLSNAQIVRVLERLRQYRWSIVTEHQPVRPWSVNADQAPGDGIRLFPGWSGVYPDQPPFSAPATVLLETPVTDKITSYLIDYGDEADAR